MEEDHTWDRFCSVASRQTVLLGLQWKVSSREVWILTFSSTLLLQNSLWATIYYTCSRLEMSNYIVWIEIRANFWGFWSLHYNLNQHLHVSNCDHLCLIFSRLIYFGGYGHKLLTDVDSRNRSFIVDEASWVMCFLLIINLSQVWYPTSAA